MRRNEITKLMVNSISYIRVVGFFPIINEVRWGKMCIYSGYSTG